MSSETLSLATAPKADSRRWSQQPPATWAETLDWLALDAPADHKECGGFVLGELRGGVRRKDSVVHRSAVALDADYASQDFALDSATELGCALALYTTWRHTPEKPRWRLLAPLSRDVSATEYRLIAGALMVSLGAEQFDAGSAQPERFMWRPSTQGDYEHAVFPGEPLDADQWLAEAKGLGLEDEPARERVKPSGPRREPSAGVHPYAARAIAGELAKLDDLPQPWEPGTSFWDQTTFAVACNLIEFANSPWAGYDLEDAKGDLFDHAPQDEEWGPQEHAVKWLSALNRVGDGARESPDESPEDVFTPFEEPDDLFDATPVLRHIRTAAHSRMVSAPALLGYTLARVLAEVRPDVNLPPTVGGPASLNLGVAVVGESGAGKSALMKVSRELLGLVGEDQREIEKPLGSGEGIAQSFLRLGEAKQTPDGRKPKEKVNVLIEDPRRIFTVDEVESLGATGVRNGSTIAPTIRSALTGDALGQENATAERRRHVPGNAYRLVLLVGVQPTRSDVLLKDADAGTPQRFVWVPATDPTVPDEPAEWPGVLEAFRDLDGGVEEPCTEFFEYPDSVKGEIRAARLRGLRGEADAAASSLEGHLSLTRLKVGAALALLHGETYISEQWWELAGIVTERSMQQQEECRAVLRTEEAKKNASSARASGRAEAIKAEVVDADKAAMARARAAILKAVTAAGAEGVLWSKARLKVQHKDRADFAMRARTALEAEGTIQVEDVTQGQRKGERLHLG